MKHLHLALQSPFSFHHKKSTGGSYICPWGALSAHPLLKATHLCTIAAVLLSLKIHLPLGLNHQLWWIISLCVKSWLHTFTISWCKIAYLLRMGIFLLLWKQLKWERGLGFGVSAFSIPLIPSLKLNLSSRAIFRCQLWPSADLLSVAHGAWFRNEFLSDLAFSVYLSSGCQTSKRIFHLARWLINQTLLLIHQW